MEKIKDAGSPINLEKAKRLVEAYHPVRLATTAKILSKVTDDDLNDSKFAVRRAMEYHSVNVNAYLFDAGLVTRFFEGHERAEYLMVFLAADDDGKPTLVLAGLNKVAGKDKEFVSLNINDPGTQHPPKYADLSFPGPEKANDGRLLVKLY
ncbi:MAG TPA: hypothetical protein VGD40_12000 [Chryseosolibacter sp.]